MTHPTKCQRQAKQQRASKVKVFDSGFIQDLLVDVALDQDYKPKSDVEHPNSSDSDTDSESQASNGMSFSLMDSSNIASEDGVGDSDDDEESDAEITLSDNELAITNSQTLMLTQRGVQAKLQWPHTRFGWVSMML
ncbi:hypothetical protein OG21DRAFT_1525928 [Imleria badia]|nr:hypothetical protein OG21DRAFT_1525928 [Imleria badia]